MCESAGKCVGLPQLYPGKIWINLLDFYDGIFDARFNLGKAEQRKYSISPIIFRGKRRSSSKHDAASEDDPFRLPPQCLTAITCIAEAELLSGTTLPPHIGFL